MSKDREAPTHAVNLICEGTLIMGDIRTTNDIRIDGIIKGKIDTSGRVVIGNTGKVEGDIKCSNIDIQGYVLGDMAVSGHVSLKAPANITGNITSSTLSIESGVVFNGNSQMVCKETSKP